MCPDRIYQRVPMTLGKQIQNIHTHSHRYTCDNKLLRCVHRATGIQTHSFTRLKRNGQKSYLPPASPTLSSDLYPQPELPTPPSLSSPPDLELPRGDEPASYHQALPRRYTLHGTHGLSQLCIVDCVCLVTTLRYLPELHASSSP